MSQSPPGSSVEDKTFFPEYRCHPELRVPPLPTSPPGKPGSITAPDTASFSAASSPTACEPRRIVLSTESPAALKVGTQQLIPKSLAVSTKTKNPSRHQSFGAAGLSKEPLCPDPKRASAPSISLEAEVEDDYGGALKRNLRNMSYRAAMRGLGAEPEPVNAATSLRPVPEEGSALPARSPGRNKPLSQALQAPLAGNIPAPLGVAAPLANPGPEDAWSGGSLSPFNGTREHLTRGVSGARRKDSAEEKPGSAGVQA
nr:PREDICTED: rho guanine nucleotide exchange factor 16-like [Apteryx mantelli mantelli]